MCVSVCVSVRVSERVSACMSLTSDSPETVEAIIIQLGTATAPDMRIHRVLFILTITFIQGHTDHNENNKCSIISETV